MCAGGEGELQSTEIATQSMKGAALHLSATNVEILSLFNMLFSKMLLQNCTLSRQCTFWFVPFLYLLNTPSWNSVNWVSLHYREDS